MSYCRFGERGSDVYVICTGDNHLECMACCLNSEKTLRYTTRKEMINHLKEHMEKGHTVPSFVFKRLECEINELGDSVGEKSLPVEKITKYCLTRKIECDNEEED